MRRLFAILLLFIFVFPTQVHASPAGPTITADWNESLKQISVKWGDISSFSSDEYVSKYRLYYRALGQEEWIEYAKNIAWTSTGMGVKDVLIHGESYEFILRAGIEEALPTSNIASAKSGHAGGFQADAFWENNSLYIRFSGYSSSFIDSGVDITLFDPDGKSYSGLQGGTLDRRAENSIANVAELRDVSNTSLPTPQEGETWVVRFIADGKTINKTVNCWEEFNVHDKTKDPFDPESSHADGAEPLIGSGAIPIFMDGSWPVIMFWYYALASLLGVFIFLTLIRSGYQYMVSGTSNPGLKASFFQTIERCIVAIIIIIVTPYLVSFLIELNDSLVHLFANIVDNIIGGDEFGLDLPQDQDSDKWLSRVVAFPFQALINLINLFFGLHPLGDVIFNGRLNTTILSNNYLFTGGLQTGNPFSQALLNLALIAFTLYFNAVYTIRRWVVIAVMAATPIIAWIWVLTSRRNVIEIWLSELIQTIFMQVWHALTFGIFFSILCFGGAPLTFSAVAGTENTAQMLITIGKWLAGFGGVVCIGVIIIQGFRLALAQNENTVAEVKERIKNALIGLVILSLSLMIASFLTSGDIKVIQPIIQSSEKLRITFWQLFFVLMTIIPVSKMLSMVFMSIVARLGTVDEHSEAAKGLGVLGMLGGIAMLGKAGATALGGGGIVGGASNAGAGGINTHSGVSAGGPSGGFVGHSVGTGAAPSYLSSHTPSVQGISTPQSLHEDTQNLAAGGAQGLHEGHHNLASISSPRSLHEDTQNLAAGGAQEGLQGNISSEVLGTPEIPGIYKGNAEDQIFDNDNPYGDADEIFNNPEEVIATFRGDSETSPPIETEGLSQAQEKKFTHTLNKSQSHAGKVGEIGSNMGMVSGSFVGASGAMAAFMGGGAKVASAPITTALNLGNALVKHNKINRDLMSQGHEPISFTGRSTKFGAATQTLTAIALSPFGSTNIPVKAGQYADKTGGWVSKVDMYN